MVSENKIRNKDNKEGGGIWKLKDTKRREKLDNNKWSILQEYLGILNV